MGLVSGLGTAPVGLRSGTAWAKAWARQAAETWSRYVELRLTPPATRGIASTLSVPRTDPCVSVESLFRAGYRSFRAVTYLSAKE